MNSKISIFATVLVAVAHQVAADTCYGIAFGSGDDSAAYQAGVLKGLVETLGAEKTAYSAVSGVGGGAVSAAILGSFPVGSEATAADRMVSFWEHASNNRLYKDWLGGIAEGLTVKGGVYNNAALAKFLETELSDIGSMQRYVDVGITDILTGTFNENTDSLNTNLQDVMFASFAYPGFFPPAESMGSAWFSGSVIWDLDMFSPINKCRETHADSDIVLDVVLTSRKSLKPRDASNFNTVQIAIRAAEVIRYYGVMDALLRGQFAYPEVNIRYIISPSDELPHNLYPLSLDQSQVDTAVAMGQADAQAAINAGSQLTNDTLEFFLLKKRRDSRVYKVQFEQFLEMKANGLFSKPNEFLQ